MTIEDGVVIDTFMVNECYFLSGRLSCFYQSRRQFFVCRPMRGGAFFGCPIVPSVASRRIRVCFSRLYDHFLALRSHSSPRTALPVCLLSRVLVSTLMATAAWRLLSRWASSFSASSLLHCGTARPKPLLCPTVLVATASRLGFLRGMAQRPGSDGYSLMRYTGVDLCNFIFGDVEALIVNIKYL